MYDTVESIHPLLSAEVPLGGTKEDLSANSSIWRMEYVAFQQEYDYITAYLHRVIVSPAKAGRDDL